MKHCLIVLLSPMFGFLFQKFGRFIVPNHVSYSESSEYDVDGHKSTNRVEEIV